jgi:hypothetical protein
MTRRQRGEPANVRPRLEALERRDTPTTFVVTALLDNEAGSLRDAVARANDETENPGPDIIQFGPAVQGKTINLLTFSNPGASTLIVPQPAGPSALLITSTITIQGTGETITRGGTAGFRLFQVTAGGRLTLSNLTLSNGLARGGVGAPGGGGAAGLGGAIYNQGRLEILGTTLVGNTAEGGAGGPTGGDFRGFGGGGLGQAGVDGGGPNGGVAGGPGPGFGGGGGGGNLGLGRAAQDGGFGGGGGGGIAGFGGGNGGFGGGGGDVFGGNSGFGGFGGGNGSPAGTTDGNAGSGAGMGGAIFNQGGTVIIRNSTITGNVAAGGGGANGGQAGGGFGGGVFNLNGPLVLDQVTIARNTVAAGVPVGSGVANTADGGAVYNLSLDVGSATANQSAEFSPGNSILADSTGGADVVNHQLNGTATVNATQPNIASTAVTNTGGAVAGTTITIADPNLGPLADNGGPTRTMALNPGSLAIDAGSKISDLSDDQRGPGFSRISNGAADLGAFEFQAPVVNPETLPEGRVGVPYSQILTATGRPGPFTFAITAGALPVGFTLAPTGELTGVSPRPGFFAFTVTATDPAGVSGRRAYGLSFPFTNQPSVVGGLPDGTARVLTPSNDKYDLGSTLSFFPGQPVAVRVVSADVTGDGVPDFVGGTGPGIVTRVAVIDGVTNKEVVSWQPFESAFTGGVFVAALDLDLDGRAEVVVCPDQGGGPVAAVFAGAKLAAGTGGDAAQLVRFFGIDDPGFRGGARPALGDVTGDGKADLVVAAGFLGGPRVTVWDGASVLAGAPAQLLNFFAFEDTLRNGAFVAAGDMTSPDDNGGDGIADLAFGGGPGGAPRVRLFDGKALLAAGPFASLDEVGSAQKVNFFAGDPALRGGVRLALRDADDDGEADLITGSGEGEPSRVRLFLEDHLIGDSSTTADQDLDPFAGGVLIGGVFVG